MVLPWVLGEMKTADLKDKRLNNRLKEVLSRLGGHPTAARPFSFESVASSGYHSSVRSNRRGIPLERVRPAPCPPG